MQHFGLVMLHVHVHVFLWALQWEFSKKPPVWRGSLVCTLSVQVRWMAAVPTAPVQHSHTPREGHLHLEMTPH